MRGHMDKTASGSTPRHNRVICIPFSPSVKDYNKTVHDPAKFRAFVDARIKQFPELFPAEITAGYSLIVQLAHPYVMMTS